MKGAGVDFDTLVWGNLGNGGQIRFWLDIWNGADRLKDRFPLLFSLVKDKHSVIKEVVKVDNGTKILQLHWIRRPASSEEFEELVACSNMLSDLELHAGDDKWMWKGSADGFFTVGNVKKLLQAAQHQVPFYSFEWVKWIPVKCNVFAWRAEMDRLPTRKELQKRNVYVDSDQCALCGDQEETANHIFTGCVMAAGVWQAVSEWCGIPQIFAFTFKDLLELHKSYHIPAHRKEVFRGIWIVACWRMWKARNELIFEKRKTSVAEIVADTKAMGFLWYKNRKKDVCIDWIDWCKFKIM